jgi:hypothetical protein
MESRANLLRVGSYGFYDILFLLLNALSLLLLWRLPLFIKIQISNDSEIHKTALYETHKMAFMARHAYKIALCKMLGDLPFFLFTPTNILFFWRTYGWIKACVLNWGDTTEYYDSLARSASIPAE